METKDLYKVLEVSKGASQDEIRRSYRRLARKYHPDANPGDEGAEERFKGIQQAYEILSNPEKRREYDEGPRQFFGAGNAGQRTGAGTAAGADFQNFSDLSDLFGGFGNLGDVFGQATTNARGRGASPKGEDVNVSVRLKFKDALEGVTTRVGVPVEEACGDCGGSGAAPGTSPRTCPQCGGRGTQSRDQGLFALSTACTRCGGRGSIVETPCPRCRGGGKTRGVKQVKVRIPAGARDGMKVRVPGRGGAGRNGGPAGDLFVLTEVEEHPVFKRKGDDFVVTVPVSFVEASLGAEIEAPKPGGGTVRLRIPAGTQSGKQFKVRGAGAPRTRRGGSERGDLIVRVGVVVPKKLRRREREILEALAEERDEDVRAELFRRVGP
jgi:molecular chaperone DnaJ